jgi:hypothetical protein
MPQPLPVPSTVTYFPLSNAPLPTPTGWWRHPSSLPSSLVIVRDDYNGSDIHPCSCHCVFVVFGCHADCRVCVVCHPESSLLPLPPPNHQRAVAVPLPRPPPLPLPSQLYSLQLLPPPLPRCRFPRRLALPIVLHPGQ